MDKLHGNYLNKTRKSIHLLLLLQDAKWIIPNNDKVVICLRWHCLRRVRMIFGNLENKWEYNWFLIWMKKKKKDHLLFRMWTNIFFVYFVIDWWWFDDDIGMCFLLRRWIEQWIWMNKWDILIRNCQTSNTNVKIGIIR